MKRIREKDSKMDINGTAPEDDALSVQKRIALRAYELFLQRGGVDGHAEDDWLEAERQILRDQER